MNIRQATEPPETSGHISWERFRCQEFVGINAQAGEALTSRRLDDGSSDAQLGFRRCWSFGHGANKVCHETQCLVSIFHQRPWRLQRRFGGIGFKIGHGGLVF